MADERYPFLSQFLEKMLPEGGDKTDKTSEREQLSVSSGTFEGDCRKDLPEQILSCSECPWWQANPWSPHPGLSKWCHYHMDGLLKDNPQCISYRQGEVPPRRGKGKENE